MCYGTQKFDATKTISTNRLTTTVLLPIDYRSEEDDTQHHIKVRKSMEILFTHV